jgi:hypothetical protein
LIIILIRVFQQINDPKSVIAFAERLVGAASRREEKQSQYLAVASFRFAAFAMTIGHFFIWSASKGICLIILFGIVAAIKE